MIRNEPDQKDLNILARALKSYSSPKQFEKDWDCKLLTAMGDISGVVFNNDSAITAFYLKHSLAEERINMGNK